MHTQDSIYFQALSHVHVVLLSESVRMAATRLSAMITVHFQQNKIFQHSSDILDSSWWSIIGQYDGFPLTWAVWSWKDGVAGLP